MTSTPAPPALAPLEPGQRLVMHVHAAIPSLILTGLGFGLGKLVEDQLGWPWWPALLVAGAIALWNAVIAPRRRWAAWGWALADDELHVARGIWTRMHTIVPLTRVQHIDVSQGPLERACGVARLIVHTAGTAHATVTLPGITRERAEALRDVIRSHVRDDPW